MWKPWIPKRNGTVRGVVTSQMVSAMPINPNRRPIVTTSCTTSVDPTSRRISTTSRNTPNSGAATNTVSTMAARFERPWLIESSQNTNAMSIPIAPWAKLKMPVDV